MSLRHFLCPLPQKTIMCFCSWQGPMCFWVVLFIPLAQFYCVSNVKYSAILSSDLVHNEMTSGKKRHWHQLSRWQLKLGKSHHTCHWRVTLLSVPKICDCIPFWMRDSPPPKETKEEMNHRPKEWLHQSPAWWNRVFSLRLLTGRGIGSHVGVGMT